MIQASTPYLSERYIEEVASSLRSSYGLNRNQYTEKLIRLMSKSYPERSIGFFSNCTSAIHAVLSVLAAKHRDKSEVIVPALSWVSTASSVLNAGLKPVFVDVDPWSACIDAKKIEEKVNSNTLAVMAVDLFGNLSDYGLIKSAIEQNSDIYLLQDAAESLGATLADGTKAGMSGDIGFFSFHATKLINCGQGGAALFKDADLARQVKKFAHHGIDTVKTGKYYWSDELGLNYSWSDFQAALAFAQFSDLDKLVQERRDIFSSYDERIIVGPNIELMHRLEYCNQMYWLPFFASRNFKTEADRAEFINQAELHKIQFRPMFYPLPAMPPFTIELSATVEEMYPNASDISLKSLTLPTGARANYKDISFVCDYLNEKFSED